MTRVRAFQSLVIASALLHVIWVVLPFAPIEYSRDVSHLLELDGHDGLPILKHPIFYVPFMVVKLAATLGLFLFVPWGRLLLVAVLLLGVVTTLLGGVAVIAPLDHLVLSMLYLSEGAILAISFTAPIATYFKPHVTNGRADD